MFLFETQLLLVRQMLPFAATADAVMLTHGIDPHRRFFDETHDTPLHEATPFAADLYVDHVARHGHRNEHDDVVPSPERLALGGYGDDFELLDQRMIRFFSSHLFSRFVFYHSN